ncbi:MAG: DMT family transporter [Gammaproteobacteria bacterium]|nr:DMT family transporter [Gammaproteobacteria bacterium]MBI5619142.1 DMT family transporter [Gammaproteobacteria bacterium]
MSTALRSQAVTGTLLVFWAAVGFSLKAVLVKLAYAYGVDTVTLLALRMGFSLPFFLAAMLWVKGQETRVPLTARDALTVCVLGFIGYYLSSYLDFIGLRYVSAGLERLILFAYPTIVLLISAAFLRRPITLADVCALVLSYVGIGLACAHDVSFKGPDGVAGALWVLASALTYALYLIGSGQMITRLGVVQFTAYAMTVSCVVVMAQFLVGHPLAALVLPVQVYEYAAVMALVSTVLPAFMLSAGIRRIGASQASLISAIGPISTIVFAHLLLDEPVTGIQILGTVLVCAGTLAVSGVLKKRPKP